LLFTKQEIVTKEKKYYFQIKN